MIEKHKLCTKIGLLLESDVTIDLETRSFLKFLFKHLEQLDLSWYKKNVSKDISHIVPEIVVDAFEVLRTSDAPWAIRCREEYENETGYPIPDVMNIGASDIIIQQLTVNSVMYRPFTEMMGEKEIAEGIKCICNAQLYSIMQLFGEFAREVYRDGFHSVIQNTKGKCISSWIGNTELSACSLEDPKVVHISFSRTYGKPNYNITFVVKANEPFAYGAYIHSCNTNVSCCLEMIQDVIANWPQEELRYNNLFREVK